MLDFRAVSLKFVPIDVVELRSSFEIIINHLGSQSIV